MTSEIQKESNRENSKKSTGPRSARGKSMARFNAVSYGIFAREHLLPGEDPDYYTVFAAEIFNWHNPVGPAENAVCKELLGCYWQLERLHKVEPMIFAASLFELFPKTAQGRDGVGPALRGEVAEPQDPELQGTEQPTDSAGQIASARKVATLKKKDGEEHFHDKEPPLGLVLLNAYVSGTTGKHSKMIDRQIERVTSRLLHLLESLEIMQKKRGTREREAG